MYSATRYYGALNRQIVELNRRPCRNYFSRPIQLLAVPVYRNFKHDSMRRCTTVSNGNGDKSQLPGGIWATLIGLGLVGSVIDWHT